MQNLPNFAQSESASLKLRAVVHCVLVSMDRPASCSYVVFTRADGSLLSPLIVVVSIVLSVNVSVIYCVYTVGLSEKAFT